MHSETIRLDRTSHKFAKKITSLSGTDLSMCWHCLSCANGCPFLDAMDYHPNKVIRLVQFGLLEEVLNCRTIWICVGCNTCSVECPNAIDIPAVMDAIRQEAIKTIKRLPEKNILIFHRLFLQSIRRHGRTHKLEIMFFFKMRTMQFFSDTYLGVRMLVKRKLDLWPSKIRNLKEIRNLFKKEKLRDEII